MMKDERALYNDIETMMVKLIDTKPFARFICPTYHTTRISNDERVQSNDTETLMVRLLSHSLGSYVTHFLHTAMISNDKRVLYNDTETLMVRLLSHLLQPRTKALGTVLQYSYFSVISRFPLKTVHPFQNFLAVLQPPTLYKVETRNK